MRQKPNQVELLIDNWHSLVPLEDRERSVGKKGRGSDVAYACGVLGKLFGYQDIVVINDEAHDACRTQAETEIGEKEAEELAGMFHHLPLAGCSRRAVGRTACD